MCVYHHCGCMCVWIYEARPLYAPAKYPPSTLMSACTSGDLRLRRLHQALTSTTSGVAVFLRC